MVLHLEYVAYAISPVSPLTSGYTAGANDLLRRSAETSAAERRPTLLDGPDPLLRVQPEVAVGDRSGCFLERGLGPRRSDAQAVRRAGGVAEG